MTVLTVEGLRSGYGAADVVRGVDLHVGDGECLGIIGPNGHGKTTLLRTISGLVPARSGSVRLGDEELVGLAPHRIARKGVVHVPQGDMIFTDLSVAENLRLAESIGRRAGRAGATLAEVHDVFPVLAERRAQQAGTLSGGERRMLALARGMLVAAEVLLIDEPSLGLAPAVVATVYAHIATLRETGRAMVVVDESPMRLRGIADRLCLIDRGSVVAAGRTEELLGNESVLKTYLGMEVAV